MNQNSVFLTDFMLKLTDGFEERLTFDIAYRTAYFNDGNSRLFIGEITIKTALNFVCNVRNYLYCAPAVIAPPFFLKHGPIDFTRCDI